MNLCFEEKVEKRQGASYIRRLLEEAWSTEGMCDTYLWIKLNGMATILAYIVQCYQWCFQNAPSNVMQKYVPKKSIQEIFDNQF